MKASRTALTIALAALVFGLTFVYRFNLLGGQLSGFENDEYLVISRAVAMLRGEIPSRDFVDPGYPLAYVASALSIDATGGLLLGHAVLTVSMLALGATLTFLVGRAASGSLAVGLLVAFIHVCLGPRLYNYPKIVLYALAVLGWWAYVDRPHRLKLIALGVLTAVAFLFRHDHGAYIAIGTLVMIAAAGHDAGLARTLDAAVVYGLVASLCVVPYLIFLQRSAGVLEHVQVGLEFSRVDSNRTQLRWPRFTFNLDAPLVETAPSPDRAVEPPAASAWTERLRAMPILRTRVAPGVLTPENAAPFVYYLFLMLPVVAAWLCLSAVRGASDAGAWRDVTEMAPIIVITVMLNQWFLRGTLPVRLADVSVLTAALGAWLLARAWRAARAWGGLRRATAGVALFAIVALTTMSAASIGAVGLNLRTVSDANGLAGVLSRGRLVREQLETRGPVLAAGMAGGSTSMRVADYLHACLRPTDRALVIGYRPEVFYFADRRFAGGQVDLRAGYLARPRDQQLVIERMRQQSVPIVITEEKAVFEERYRSESPVLLAYLDEVYADTGDRPFGAEVLRVLIRRDRVPTGIYAAVGAACFG